MSANWLYQYSDGTTDNKSFRIKPDGTIDDNSKLIGGPNDATGGAAGVWGLTSMAPGNGASAPTPNVSSAGGSFGGSVGSPYGSQTYGPNPYLAQQASSIQAQANQNLQQNVMPGIRSSAQANGQYGGTRQGIAEGIAAGNAQTGVAAAQAGLYGSGYNTDQANQTARIGLSNNYNLGLGSLGNQATAQNQNFYTQQRGQDLQQYQIGSGLYGSGVNGQLGVGSSQYGVGNTAYQAPLNTLQQYSNTLSPYTGLNSAQQQNVQGPGVVNSAIGGALAGGQIAKNLGFGSSTTNTSGGYGAGTGAAYGNQDYGLYF